MIDERRFPGRQGRLLFAYLVAEQGRAVPRDELAEAVWGDTPPATWEKALTVLASKLRALLAECGLDAGTVLTSAFGCYRLALPDGAWVDVVAAADAVRDAEAAVAREDLEQAKTLAGLAASIARRPFLPGDEGEWLDAKRRELNELLRRALDCLVDACARSGDAQAATRWAEEAIALEPYRETAYRRLMLAHAAAGNRGEALRVYERCRRLLAEELGAYPSPETESVYRELLSAPRPEPKVFASDPAPANAHEIEPHSGRPRGVNLRTATGGAALLLTLLVGVAVVIAARIATSEARVIEPNAVGLIDGRGNRVRDQIAVDAAPTSIAFGYGALWAAHAYANTVSRIDPETHSVRQTVAVGSSPSGIAIGGGAVWVANHDDGTVSWISPDTNAVVREVRVGNGPLAVAFGFGSVWITNSVDRTLSRIQADTGDVVTIHTGAVGRGVAIGAGSVWVTDEATRRVLQIDPATNRVTNAATVGSGPGAIAYGAGALWVANELDGTMSIIEPRTLAVRSTIPVVGSPSALAFGAGGLWVSSEFGGRVVRIDTSTRRETETLRIGNRPKGLAISPGGLWVAVQPSGSGHRGGRLVVLGDNFDTIDPGLADSTDSFMLVSLAYDGLTAFRRVGGSEGTQLVADLAATLPLPTDAGKSYTFTLRPGIRYSDGSLVRARDFKRALERMFTLGAGSLHGTALVHVVGASSCKPTKACDLSRGFIVNGPSSLTIRLSVADPRLLLSLTSLAPVPRGTPASDVGTHPIPSTGPYTIESYVPDRQLTLTRNRYFRVWSRRARPDGYPDEILWRVGMPREVAIRRVLAGKADLLLSGVPAGRVQQLVARHPRQIHLIPQRATAFVFLNTRRPPFDDMRVRKAVNYALDRSEMAELHGGLAVAQPTCQAVPPAVPGYRRYCPYTTDPDKSGEWKAPDLAKARQLVGASGTRGARIVVWTFPFFGKEGRYFVSLLRALGYRAELKAFGRIDAYFAALNRTPDVQAGFAGWFGFRLAADTFQTVSCGYSANWAHFCDRRFDAQARHLAVKQASDPTAGVDLAARLDRVFVDRASWVPLFTPRLADLTSERVGNYQANTYASATVLLDQLWVR